MTTSQRLLFWAAIAIGLLYIALIPLKPYPLGWVLKPIPMLIYAVLLWQAFPGTVGRWLAFGYVGAAFGDFFLDFGNRDGLFSQALVSFLVNQIALAVAFFILARKQALQLPRYLPVLVYAVVLALWILPIAGALQIPVTIYLLCLTIMAVLASRIEAKIGALWLGAMLFVIADSLIGINKFADPFPYSTFIIVSIYFSGQSLIAWGLLQHSRLKGA